MFLDILEITETKNIFQPRAGIPSARKTRSYFAFVIDELYPFTFQICFVISFIGTNYNMWYVKVNPSHPFDILMIKILKQKIEKSNSYSVGN